MNPITRFIISALPKPDRKMAPVQWFGGKGRMSYKLLPLIPQGKVFVEPYGGAANILIRRKPVEIEVYNDLDDDIVNLFRALQSSSRCTRLVQRIVWTLYSRSEYERAVKTLQNPRSTADARAWAIFIAQNQGIGGLRNHSASSWGRVVTPVRSCKKTNEWRSRIASLLWWHERLTKVMIEKRDALEVIQTWDSADTVFYVDPPYVASTRKSGSYVKEVDDEHHKALIELLLKVKGAVILSGYDNPLYDSLTKAGWEKQNFQTYCSAYSIKRKPGEEPPKRATRIETVWRNKRALQMCHDEERARGGRSE